MSLTSAHPSVDPITFAVIRNGLISAAHEMYWVFKRTAMLPLLYEFNDFGMSLFDHRFNCLGDAPGLPIFLGSLDTCLVETTNALGGLDNLAPGDVLFSNHPYVTAGQTADAAVMEPIFFDGDLIGFSALRAHMGDFGAINLYPCNSTDVYQEGTLFPALKLYDKGDLNKTVIEILEANSRLPTETAGSVLAAVGAARACTGKVQAIVEKYGMDTYLAAVEMLLDHGERAVRDAIARIPDGTYIHEEYMDDNGVEDEPVYLKCTMTVDGSNLTVDTTGSAEQQTGPFNCPWGYTLTACRFALKRLTTPDLPANSGEYRPIKVIAPEGSIFNATSPAPVFCSVWTALRLGDMMVHALAQAIPDRVPAQSAGDVMAVLAYVNIPETKRVAFFVDLGALGFGAPHDRDGMNALMHPIQAGSESMPAEILETRMPVLKRRFELVTDSGGPGRFRGGLSAVSEFEFLSDGVATAVAEKTKTAEVLGLDGGLGPPAKNAIIMFPETDKELRLGKMAGIPINAGDVFRMQPAGGGGYGDPLERDPSRVAWDVRNQYVSAAAAEQSYGVLFDSGSGEVDVPGTAELRKRLSKKERD